MRRLLVISGLVVFLWFGGWLFLNRNEIRKPADLFRIVGHKIGQLGGGATPQYAPWRGQASQVIRIGTFNTNHFDEQKMKDPHLSGVMADIIRHFDVIALQEIDMTDPFAVKRFLRKVNSTGREFRLVQGVRQGDSKQPDQSVILYDASTVVLEDGQYYHVNDPDDVLRRDPLVAWFRVRGQSSHDKNVFTFSLVNVHLDIHSPHNEMLQLGQIFRAVRNDGRMEDDIVLAGDFGVQSRLLMEVAQPLGLLPVNVDDPTNTQQSTQLDNFMVEPLATAEFTGDTGTFDFLKIYNLTLQEALAVSDHMPVWAEFEVHEIANPGPVAEATSADDSAVR